MYYRGNKYLIRINDNMRLQFQFMFSHLINFWPVHRRERTPSHTRGPRQWVTASRTRTSWRSGRKRSHRGVAAGIPRRSLPFMNSIYHIVVYLAPPPRTS